MVTCAHCDLPGDLGQCFSKCGPQLSSSRHLALLAMQILQLHPTQGIGNRGEGASNMLVQTLQVVLMPSQAWEPLIWSIEKADKMKSEVHRHWIVSESI